VSGSRRRAVLPMSDDVSTVSEFPITNNQLDRQEDALRSIVGENATIGRREAHLSPVFRTSGKGATPIDIRHWALGRDGVFSARLNPAVERLWLPKTPEGPEIRSFGELRPTCEQFVVETSGGFARYEHVGQPIERNCSWYFPTVVVENGTDVALRLEEQLIERFDGREPEADS